MLWDSRSWPRTDMVHPQRRELDAPALSPPRDRHFPSGPPPLIRPHHQPSPDGGGTWVRRQETMAWSDGNMMVGKSIRSRKARSPVLSLGGGGGGEAK